MTAYRNILIAVDLNGQPQQVLKKAAAYAGSDTKISLVYVLSDLVHLYSGYMGEHAYSRDPDILNRDKMQGNAMEKVQALVEQSGVAVDNIFIEFGRAADIIIDTAEQQESDLIIVGSHGRHGVRILLGSTANAVLHRAKSDVLAVRIKDEK